MIQTLIEQAHRRATMADAVLSTDETTTLEFAAGRMVSAATSTSQGVNLRVVAEGRVGIAGTTAEDGEDLLDRALESARVGELAVLTLPRPMPLPDVATHFPRASSATVQDLAALATLVRDRLAGERAELSLTISRSLGSVRVANTLGVDASYDVSLVVLRLQVRRSRDARRLTIQGVIAGADLPALPELEQLVATVRQRLSWAEQEAEIVPGRQRVGFLPTAMPVLLSPVEQALVGKSALHGGSPLARRRGSRAFSELVSIHDDPLVGGRPGSRPIDDEGVVSRRLPLVVAGEIEALIYDLETAGRVGASPSGHGRRSTFGKPQAAYSNLVVEPGTSNWEELLAAIGDGLLIERLRPSGQSNLIGGTFALPAAAAWKVEGGEITGLLPEMTVAGNAHDLLGRVVAVGRDAMWVGSRHTPMLVVDGVSVF
jgi:PmbA protein